MTTTTHSAGGGTAGSIHWRAKDIRRWIITGCPLDWNGGAR